MKTKIRLIVVLLLLTASSRSFACQCWGLDSTVSFMESSFFVWEQWVPKSIIIKAQYVGIRAGYGTELKILKTYYGHPANPDTIVAWGSDGTDCRGYLGSFYQIGDTMIVSLRNVTNRPDHRMAPKA